MEGQLNTRLSRAKGQLEGSDTNDVCGCSPVTHKRPPASSTSFSYKYSNMDRWNRNNLWTVLVVYHCVLQIRNSSKARDIELFVIITYYPIYRHLFNWNFYPLEVVSRWRDSQLQVGKKYSGLNGVQRFLNLADWCHILMLYTLKSWYEMCY